MLTSFIVPATIISMSATLISSIDGFTIHSPFTRPTRTSDIGPLNGMSETAIAAEAAKPHNASGLLTPS